MSGNLLSCDQAISLIQDCHIRGIKVLGVDGFIVTDIGNVASLDLLLDLSLTDITISDAAEQAMQFVRSKCRKNVKFEVSLD